MLRQWMMIGIFVAGMTQGTTRAKDLWSPKTAKVVWKALVGVGYSSVTVDEDRLYTMGNKSNKDTVFCLNAKTGKIIWKYTYRCALGKYKGSRAAPVLDGGKLYVMSDQGELFCLDATMGKLVWRVNLLKVTKNSKKEWLIASSPAIAGDFVLLNMGSSGVAVHKATGKLAWKSKGRSGYASPLVFGSKEKPLAVISSEKKLNVVDVGTGKVLAEYDWKVSNKVNAATPLLVKDQIFITSASEKHSLLLRFSAGALEPVWESDVLKYYFNSCVVVDGYIFGVDGERKRKSVLRCLSFKDGTEAQSKEMSFASLSENDGKLIVLDEAGTLHFIRATLDSFDDLYTFKTGLKKLCWTPPVFANNMIYCRNSLGALVAISVQKEKKVADKKAPPKKDKK